MKKVICGVYKISSKFYPDRIYIGGTKNILKRWDTHLSGLKNNNHPSKKLQEHYNTCGESDLCFTLIVQCPLSLRRKIEKLAIRKLKPYFNTNNERVNGKYEIDTEYISNVLGCDMNDLLGFKK